MTTFTIKRSGLISLLPIFKVPGLVLLLFILALIYRSLTLWIYRIDSTASLPDAGIWSLVLLAIMVFLMLLLLSGYLLKSILKCLGFPAFNGLVSQFKTLTLWQQYVFYWVSFALLLLAAIGCLIAIC